MPVYNLTFHFLSLSSQHPIHLPESYHTLHESRAAEAKSTALITLQTTKDEIYCKFPNKHQYFDISAWVVLTKVITSELVYNFR